MEKFENKFGLPNSTPNTEQSEFESSASSEPIYPNDGMTRTPPYLDLWEIEKGVDLNFWRRWHQDNWYVAFLVSVLYLATIFGLRRVMLNRSAFDLRKYLIGWNLGLAAFSFIGVVRSVPALVFALDQPNGLYVSICTKSYWSAGSVFWGVAFAWSKIVELGDTLFIVLRKKPLTFLHYYHHVTVLCFIWTTGTSLNSTNLWFGVVNCGIHALMYSYYAAKAARVDVFKPLAMSITSLQLLQMFVGVWINSYVLFAKFYGIDCSTKTGDVLYALLIYSSYVILFGNFFTRAYLRKHWKTE